MLCMVLLLWQPLVWQCSYSNGYHSEFLGDIQVLCCYGNCYYCNIVMVTVTMAMLLSNIHTVIMMMVLWYWCMDLGIPYV